MATVYTKLPMDKSAFKLYAFNFNITMSCTQKLHGKDSVGFS